MERQKKSRVDEDGDDDVKPKPPRVAVFQILFFFPHCIEVVTTFRGINAMTTIKMIAKTERIIISGGSSCSFCYNHVVLYAPKSKACLSGAGICNLSLLVCLAVNF